MKCAACEAPRPGTAPPENVFVKLINPENWECPTCEVSNKKDLQKCAACDAPRPGTEAAAASAPGSTPYSFGTLTFGTTSTTPFTFGSSTAGSGFTFGSTTSTWNFSNGDSASPFTFGSGSTGAVTFGDVSGGPSFGSGTPTSFEPAEQLATGGDQTKEEFKNKTAEPSGTDKDITILKMATQVYHLAKVEGKGDDASEKKDAMKFVECGEGELKINTIQEGDKKYARVVLRVEKTQRLVLNARLFTGMTLATQGDKYVKFCSNDPDDKPTVYLLKFKNKTETTLVKEHMDKAIAYTEQ